METPALMKREENVAADEGHPSDGGYCRKRYLSGLALQIPVTAVFGTLQAGIDFRQLRRELILRRFLFFIELF